jgi:predicted negative regulator of RcsB-dependent stress response
MIGLQFKLLALLYYRPLAAFGRIIDEGSWIFGAVLVLLLSVWSGPSPTIGFFQTIVGLGVLFVPACIWVVTLLEATGSFGVVLRRDYGPLFTCTLMAWAAVQIPLVLISLTIPEGLQSPGLLMVFMGLRTFLFAAAMSCAVMVLFGTSGGRSVLIVVLALLVLSAAAFVLRILGPATSFLGSPLILYFLYQAFRGEMGDIGASFRSRGNFRRQLEAAAVNPHDAEPHYQLGLIYQQRRQTTQAAEEFKRAIAIDPTETDAQFQLGRIAREQGRLDEAMDYCEIVAQQNDKHSFSEVWREIGAIHLQAGRIEQAEKALTKFIDRREYDPEGLYLLGETLVRLNQPADAKEMLARAIEAVRTLPPYRRGLMRKWSKLAANEQKKLS